MTMMVAVVTTTDVSLLRKLQKDFGGRSRKLQNADDEDDNDRGNKALPEIVGGTEVPSAFTYPYFVSWGGCGGQLIHDDIVLSAAHCRTPCDGTISETLYMLGTTYGTGISRTAIQQVTHPNFNGLTLQNDFLILKLETSALVDPTSGADTGASAITLNSDSNIPTFTDGTTGHLTIMGYGATKSGGPLSDVLLEANVQGISDADCTCSYAGSVDSTTMLCGGIANMGGIDSCQGDSGGPLVDVTTGTLVGVVSWGWGCADACYPGVYAEVSSAYTWINQQICSLSSSPPSGCRVASSLDAAPSTRSVSDIVSSIGNAIVIVWTKMRSRWIS